MQAPQHLRFTQFLLGMLFKWRGLPREVPSEEELERSDFMGKPRHPRALDKEVF